MLSSFKVNIAENPIAIMGVVDTVWTVNDVLSRSTPFYWVDLYPFESIHTLLRRRVWIDSRRILMTSSLKLINMFYWKNDCIILWKFCFWLEFWLKNKQLLLKSSKVIWCICTKVSHQYSDQNSWKIPQSSDSRRIPQEFCE